MARARNIKPGFFKNEFLAELGMAAQLLFSGLWTLADREGRLENRPKRIKSEIFPYYDVDVAKVLNLLHDKGFILLYKVGVVDYIQILKFTEHQHPHVKELASTIPAPDLPVPAPDKNESKKPLSLNPITETLNPLEPTPTAVILQDVDEVQETIQRVWNYYVLIFKRASTYTFTSKRKAKAIARYQDCLKMARGDPEEAARLMKRAVDSMSSSQFHRDGGHIDWDENLFKSTEKLQWWLDKKQEKPNGKAEQRNSEIENAGAEAARILGIRPGNLQVLPGGARSDSTLTGRGGVGEVGENHRVIEGSVRSVPLKPEVRLPPEAGKTD